MPTHYKLYKKGTSQRKKAEKEHKAAMAKKRKKKG